MCRADTHETHLFKRQHVCGTRFFPNSFSQITLKQCYLAN